MWTQRGAGDRGSKPPSDRDASPESQELALRVASS